MAALRPRHLRRYHQIAEVLTRHGFGALVAQLGLAQQLNLPRRLLRQKPLEDSELTLAEHVRLALEELGPTFIKVGQLLSTRSDLIPPAFVTELSRLQDDVPPVSWESAQSAIEHELGAPIDQIFQSVEQIPFAAASLGQVHGAILTSGEEVVVKVQRPNIEQTINLDLDILMDLAQLAQVRTPLGRHYDLVELAEEFAYSLRAELDYQREGRNADRFRTNFANEPQMYVPKVYWQYTTKRVMVQERIRGIKIDDLAALEAAGHDRRQLALYSAKFIIKEILEDGFFHADPHPGNVLVLADGSIGLMDFGTVGRLATRDRVNLVRFFVMAVQMDTDGVLEQLIRMGIADYSVDYDALRRDLNRLLMRYYGVALKEISAGEMLEDLEPIIYRHHLRIPSDLWLLIKTLVIMEGVGHNLDPNFDIFEFSEPYIGGFIRRMWLPSEWGPGAMRSILNLGDLLIDLPRQTARILGQVERGDLGFQIHIPELERTTRRLDDIANRVILSVLLAALILGLALIIPNLDLTWPWNFLTWIAVLTFVIMCILAISLVWSIFRSVTRSK